MLDNSHNYKVPYLMSQSALTRKSGDFSSPEVHRKCQKMWHVAQSSIILRTFLQKLCPTAQCSALHGPLSNVTQQERSEAGPAFGNLNGSPRSGATKPITELQLSDWLRNETGLDRLKIMYALRDDGTFMEEDTRTINKMFIRSVVVGLFLNFFVTAQAEVAKKQKNLSGSQALVKGPLAEATLRKRLTRETLKSTARLTVFAGSILHLSQAIAAYRNESSVFEYAISSAVGFGAIAVGRGPRNMAVFTLAGALAGTACGALICRVLAGAGLDQQQRHMKRIEQRIQDKEAVL